ncbi:DUF1810 domain-containing protein [Sphingomonas sp.]|uniref:DUF1810 domain-containing protein n=1 Tax=Sphingomonas sp. TaxID=28214 RepID=UPI0035BBB401
MDLDRFVAAQDSVFDSVLAELRAGAKRGHWMWFVFPQISGLGRSETARFYAIASRVEARAYLAHPVLGPRLAAAVDAIMAARGSAEDILGSIDAIKLRSSMTLFEQVADKPATFARVLDRFYEGARDTATLARLG